MILGETIFSDDSTNGTDYYSPWFARGGNKATFVCNVLAHAASGDIQSFTVQVETKNQDEADSSAATVGSAATITVTNDFTNIERGEQFDGTGNAIKELVRFKYNLKAAASPTNLPCWVHFRMLAPAWSGN